MKITFERTIKIPQVPNFIIFTDSANDSDKISIADLSDEQLEAIGTNWTIQLKKRAHQIRNAPKM